MPHIPFSHVAAYNCPISSNIFTANIRTGHFCFLNIAFVILANEAAELGCNISTHEGFNNAGGKVDPVPDNFSMILCAICSYLKLHVY